MLKRRQIKWLIFLSFLVFLIGTTVFAKEVIQDFGDGLSYAKYKDSLRDFTSKVWFGNDVLGFNSEMLYLVNSLVQAGFWITKLIFQVCAYTYDFLVGASGISSYIGQAMVYNAQLFNKLLMDNQLGIGTGAIMMLAIYASYVYFVKNGSFVKVVVRFFAVLICIFIFYSKNNQTGKYLVEEFYETVQKSGSDMMSSVMITNKLPGKSEKDVILDTYFKRAIWTPYAYLNADVGDNGKDSNGFVMSDLELIALLSYKSGDDSFEINDESIKDIAGTLKEPKNSMLKDNWGAKFLYVVASWFEVSSMGLILIFFSLGAFLLGVMFLIFLYFSPWVGFFSLYPTFENAFINFFKKLLGIVMLSGMMMFLTTMAMYLYDLLSTILSTFVGTNILVLAVLKFVSLIVVWKKRDYLISLLTANTLSTRISSSLVNRFSRAGYQMSGKAMKPIKSNTQAMMALAGKGLESKMKSGYRAFSGFGQSMLHKSQQLKAHRYAEQKAKQGGDYDSAYKEYQDKRKDEFITRFKPIKDIRDKAQATYHQAKAKSYQYQAEHYKPKNNDKYKHMKKNEQYHQKKANYALEEIEKRKDIKQRSLEHAPNHANDSRKRFQFRPTVDSTLKSDKPFETGDIQSKAIEEISPKGFNRRTSISDKKRQSSFKSLSDNQLKPSSHFEKGGNKPMSAIEKTSFRSPKSVKIPQRKQLDK